MFRTLLIAATVYTFGLPTFDGHRPASFDKPLQGFYQEINVVAADGTHALGLFDEARIKHYYELFCLRLSSAIHGTKQSSS